MKQLLLVALLGAAFGVQAQESLSNGGMPSGDPQSIMVANVPMGSGVPSLGQSVGYSQATPVADGLYHVPGYLPLQASAGTMWPRVIDVSCDQIKGVWYCNGYHVDGVLERGEDIYVRPVFRQSITLTLPLTTPIQH